MQFDLVRRFGVRVIEVDEHLPHPVVWVEEMGIAFVSCGLSAQSRQLAADELLSAALTSPSRSRERS